MLTTVLLLAVGTFCIYLGGLNGPPIRSDGVGYYAYLPSLFIDHDLSMKTLAHREFGGAMPFYSGITPYNDTGNYLDKYPIGVATLVSPFFLLADVSCLVFSPANRTGFSTPYQVASIAAAIAYACVGLYLLYSALRKSFDAFAAIAAILLITYGTNVFHYASYDAAYSHIFSFFLVCVLLSILFTDVETSEGMRRRLLLAGFVFSLIVLARYSNLIFGILFVPLVLKWRTLIAADLPMAAASLTCFLLGVMPMLLLQMLYWHSVTGSWITYTYRGEGFHWLSPQFGKFLFSIQKGLFVWEPLVPLALVGVIALPPELRSFGAGILALVTIQIYLCASWPTWWFGGSFETRPFVEVMPVLAFPIAASIARIREGPRFVRSLSLALAGILVGVNLALMCAYWIGDIPYDGLKDADLVRARHRIEKILSATSIGWDH